MKPLFKIYFRHALRPLILFVFSILLVNPLLIASNKGLHDTFFRNQDPDDFGTVTFFVFDQDGVAVPDAGINVFEGGFAMTDELGLATFTLPEGMYLAEISKPLYETTTMEFTLAAGDALFLEVLLLEMPPSQLEIICPPNVEAPANDFCFAIDIDLGEPIIMDTSPGYQVTNDMTPDGFPVGISVVIWTVVNEWGETASCDQIVDITDEEPPTLSSLANLTLDNDPGACGATATWDSPTAEDNCGLESIQSSHAPGDFFPAGSTPVMYTATDIHGNATYSGFTVDVIDVEPPTVTPLANITLDNDPGECGATASWDPPTAEDNCEVVSLEGSHAPGEFFPAGSTSVMYTATDVHGNATYSGFTVDVIDVEPPTVTPLANITLDNDPGECGATASWDPPTAEDNCEVVSLEGSHAPGEFFPAGSTSVMYTATDVHGNATYSGFTVDVIDVEPPTVIPKANVTVQLDPSGNASISATQVDDGSYDICGTTDMSVSPSTFTCSDIGLNTVTLIVTDDNGNIGTATTTVTVVGECEPIPDATLEGVVNWNSSCSAKDIHIILMNNDVSGLNYAFDTEVDETGHFSTPFFEAGTYDIYVKVDGYLTRLYANTVLAEGLNFQTVDGIIPGDINGDDFVNLLDFSVLTASFGAMVGEENYNSISDFNCDGTINIIDVSILASSFGLVGAIPPLLSTE